MKKLNLIIILLAFLAIFTNAYSQNINNCLEMVYPNEDIYYNPDSVMVDTCSESLTFGKWYAKKTYVFGMKVYVFGTEALHMDSTVNWQDIDSTYIQIKNSFQNLEQQFGSYIIRRSNRGSWNDSDYIQNPVFDIYFEDYFEVDSVSNVIENIDSCGLVFLKYAPSYNDIPEIKSTNRDFPFFVDQLNNEILKINFKNEVLYSINSIKIYNLFGQQNFQQTINNQEISIDISSWASGVYIVSIGRYSKLIII